MATVDRKNARELADVAADLSPAALETVLNFARKVRDGERRGVVLLAGASLEDFAREVQRVVDASKNGWPHATDDAVFVSVAYGELEAAGSTVGVDLDTFKTRLVEAHRASLVRLSRCDLVQAARAEEVDASETAYLSARWHLIRRSRSRWK